MAHTEITTTRAICIFKCRWSNPVDRQRLTSLQNWHLCKWWFLTVLLWGAYHQIPHFEKFRGRNGILSTLSEIFGCLLKKLQLPATYFLPRTMPVISDDVVWEDFWYVSTECQIPWWKSLQKYIYCVCWMKKSEIGPNSLCIDCVNPSDQSDWVVYCQHLSCYYIRAYWHTVIIILWYFMH